MKNNCQDWVGNECMICDAPDLTCQECIKNKSCDTCLLYEQCYMDEKPRSV